MNVIRKWIRHVVILIVHLKKKQFTQIKIQVKPQNRNQLLKHVARLNTLIISCKNVKSFKFTLEHLEISSAFKWSQSRIKIH